MSCHNQQYHPHPGSRNNAARYFGETHRDVNEERVNHNVTDPDELDPLKFKKHRVQNQQPTFPPPEQKPENEPQPNPNETEDAKKRQEKRKKLLLKKKRQTIKKRLAKKIKKRKRPIPKQLMADFDRWIIRL